MVHSIQRKGSSPSADVRIGTDKGSLRLQFSSKLSKQFWGKTQYYKGLGRTDNPENRQWAEDIARRIQRDIDHPDGLFDPTLQKYLEIKASATVTMLPTAKIQPKLGEVWNEFIEWKYRTGQIAETTYLKRFKRTFTNFLKPFLGESISEGLTDNILSDLRTKDINLQNLKTLFQSLSEMSERGIQQDKLTKNYFAGMSQDIKLPKKSKQLSQEEDYKAFTREERDIIIEAFKSSDKPSERQAASLVEFLFLTGCRTGEALALQWNDVKWENGWIVFDESYSSESGITKCTKTEVTRIFKMRGLERLIKLLEGLYKQCNNPRPNDLVFKTVTGKQWHNKVLYGHWASRQIQKTNKSEYYQYDGIVTQLAKQGKISQYLKLYATRHTFITIQASTGADLKLLADSCGTSVEMIYNHYLGNNQESTLNDI